MILKVYSVFDSKLATFDRPFYMQTDAAAIRGFSDAVNDPNGPVSSWNKHPEDYSLFYLGEFDDQDGTILTTVTKSLVTASALFDTKKRFAVA